MRSASSRSYEPHPIDVVLATDELTLQFRAATPKGKAYSVDEDDTVPGPSSSSEHHTRDEQSLDNLAPDVAAHYWERVAMMDPYDSTAAVRHANAAKAYAETLSGASNAAKHMAAQKRALAAHRRLLGFEQGVRDPSAHANLGAILYKLGRHRECERSFSKAAALLPSLNSLPQPAPTLPLASIAPIHSEAATDDSGLLLPVLHGLDMCLLQQDKRKKAHGVQRLGLSLRLWRLPEQRPHTLRPGLLACGWHRKARYGHLVELLEASTQGIRDEMLRLLRVRERTINGSEGQHWYSDSEHIAARPSQWLRRRLVCDWMVHASDTESASENGAGVATPVTCSAVHAAAKWYAGSGGDVAAHSFKGGLFSLLAAGSHIRPHTGPTNERIALSLGLGGVEGAAIRIGGGAARPWVQGAAHVFDDSFEHEVRHAGTQARAVLVLHFRHPMLMGGGCPVLLAEDQSC